MVDEQAFPDSRSGPPFPVKTTRKQIREQEQHVNALEVPLEARGGGSLKRKEARNGPQLLRASKSFQAQLQKKRATWSAQELAVSLTDGGDTGDAGGRGGCFVFGCLGVIFPYFLGKERERERERERDNHFCSSF